MCPKLKSELHSAIEKWLLKECEKNTWPNIIVGDKTSEAMTNAAEAVFDGMLDSQQYMRREGLD